MLPVTLKTDEAFARVKVLAKRFVVVKAFEAYTFPETYREVRPVDPTMVWINTLLVLDTFWVVE